MELDIYKQTSVRIAPYTTKTPLLHSEVFDDLLGHSQIYLKCENFQVTGSFKPRGAFNAALQKGAHGQQFICRSSGNFGQALAYAGKKLHCSITVVMPENAPKIKIQKAKKNGATVILCGTTHQEAYKKVEELVSKGGGVPISPFDDLDVIAGQGTIALEVYEDLPSASHLFCPVGGGGLLAGCGDAIKQLIPNIEVIAAEPEGAADFSLSFKKGTPVEIENVDTIADGLRSPKVGENNWPLLKECVDSVQLVSDEEIKKAMKTVFDIFGMVIEPSAATSVAALMKTDPKKISGDVVCILSGGNVDRDQFLEWIQEV